MRQVKFVRVGVDLLLTLENVLVDCGYFILAKKVEEAYKQDSVPPPEFKLYTDKDLSVLFSGKEPVEFSGGVKVFKVTEAEVFDLLGKAPPHCQATLNPAGVEVLKHTIRLHHKFGRFVTETEWVFKALVKEVEESLEESCPYFTIPSSQTVTGFQEVYHLDPLKHLN